MARHDGLQHARAVVYSSIACHGLNGFCLLSFFRLFELNFGLYFGDLGLDELVDQLEVAAQESSTQTNFTNYAEDSLRYLFLDRAVFAAKTKTNVNELEDEVLTAAT